MARIVYSPILDKVCFYGVNVHTGCHIAVTFGEANQQYKNLLNYNPLLGKYMLSRDAGLTWTPYDSITSDFIWDNVNLIIGSLP